MKKQLQKKGSPGQTKRSRPSKLSSRQRHELALLAPGKKGSVYSKRKVVRAKPEARKRSSLFSVPDNVILSGKAGACVSPHEWDENNMALRSGD